MSVQPCGTYAAYQRHKRKGEPVCEPCRKAYGAYMAAFRAKNTLWREQQRDRSRALNRLAGIHREEFRRLYTEERTKSQRAKGALIA